MKTPDQVRYPYLNSLLALVLAFCVGYTAYRFGQELPRASQAHLDSHLMAGPAAAVAPEPEEALGYTSFLISYFLSILALKRFAFKGKVIRKLEQAERIIPWIYFAGLLYFYFNQERIFSYFSTVQALRTLLYLLFGYLIWIFWGVHKPVSAFAHLLKKYSGTLVGTYFVALLLSSLFFESELSQMYHVIEFHLPFTMEEVLAPSQGKFPLVDFYPQYQNLIGFLVAPWFLVVGVSVFSFSLCMSLLSFLALWMARNTLQEVAASKYTKAQIDVGLVLPMAALAFWPIYNQGLDRYHAFNYFALSPLRYFIPWVCLWMYSRVLHGKMKERWVYMFCALAVFNNLDFGLPVAIGIVLAQMLFQSSLKRSIGPLLSFTTATATVFTVYSVIAFLFKGEWPHFLQAIQFQTLFAKLGLSMIKVPYLGLNVVIGGTLLGVLSLSLLGRVQTPRERDRSRSQPEFATHRFCAAFAVFGFGVLMYYVGRSAWQVLGGTFWVFSFGIMLLLGAKTLRGPLKWATLTAWLICASYVPHLSLGQTYDRFALRAFGPGVSGRSQGIDPRVDQRIDRWTRQIISANLEAASSEGADIIVPYATLVAKRAGIRNTSPFAHPESILTKSQIGLLLSRRPKHIVGFLAPELIHSALHSGYTSRTIAEPTDLTFLSRTKP